MWAVTITLLAIIISLWVIRRRKQLHILKKLGIPGPEPSFWFGNMWELSAAPLECFEEWLGKYGDVMGYYFGINPVIVINDAEILKKVQVSDFQKFMNRPKIFQSPLGKPGDGFTAQLTNMNDKRWKEVRSLLTPSFTTSKLRMMVPIINGAIDSLIQIIDEKVQKNECFNIHRMYQGLTMDVIGRAAFGIQTDCQRNADESLLRTAKILFTFEFRSLFTIIQLCFPELFHVFLPIGLLQLAMKNRGRNPIKELINSLKIVIETRKKNTEHRRQDLLQLMIDAHIAESDVHKTSAQDLTVGYDEGEPHGNAAKDAASQSDSKLHRSMTDGEIIDNAMLFLLAGYETTSTTLSFATHFLLHYPDVQEQVRDEIKTLFEKDGKLDYSAVQQLQYLDQVIMESQRLYSPAYAFITREASEDVNIGNISIKKGMMIQVPMYNLHRNEKYWSEPNKFDPERFSPENKARIEPLAFQPFGFGPRNCVAMRLAKMEAKLAIARLLLKYRLEKCEETDKLDLTLRVTPALITPAKGINLKAVPL